MVVRAGRACDPPSGGRRACSAKRRLTSDASPLSPYRVLWDLQKTVDVANTIITHDAGSPRDQLSPFWKLHDAALLYRLGQVDPARLRPRPRDGRQARLPDKLCINVWGDAAIGFTGMDFETAVRERIPILSILLNNFSMAIELRSCRSRPRSTARPTSRATTPPSRGARRLRRAHRQGGRRRRRDQARHRRDRAWHALLAARAQGRHDPVVAEPRREGVVRHLELARVDAQARERAAGSQRRAARPRRSAAGRAPRSPRRRRCRPVSRLISATTSTSVGSSTWSAPIRARSPPAGIGVDADDEGRAHQLRAGGRAQPDRSLGEDRHRVAEAHPAATRARRSRSTMSASRTACSSVTSSGMRARLACAAGTSRYSACAPSIVLPKRQPPSAS
jgi:hypothetical protein